MQFFGQEKINKLQKATATTLTWPSGSSLRIGGQSYKLTSNKTLDLSTDIDTGSVAANTLYYIYAVALSGVVSLKYSLSSEAPTGFAAFRLIGNLVTNISSEIEGLENNLDNDSKTDEAGKISSFAMGEIPDGYLPCDGRQVSRTQFASLFAKIGTAHGEGNGTTTFHLPDLRGRFLRGVDGTAGRDPDKASRTAANAGGNAGNAVGSVQDDAIRNITGTFANSGTGGFADNTARSGAINASYTNSGTGWSSQSRSGWSSGFSFSANGSVPTGGDNRPANANVQYAIKY
jgi:microcystin-dependent protein